jgi:nucleoside-diphosphate-sugar epimerase
LRHRSTILPRQSALAAHQIAAITAFVSLSCKTLAFHAVFALARTLAETDEPAGIIRVIPCGRRTVDAEGFGTKERNLRADRGKPSGKAAPLIDSRVDCHDEERAGCSDAQKLSERLRSDVSLGEGSSADDAGIGAIGQRKRQGEIGTKRIAVDTLGLGDLQHLIGDIDPVGGTDPLPHQRLSHQSGAGANIENGANTAQRCIKRGHRVGAAIAHFFREIAIIATGPVTVVAHRIRRRAKRIGGVEVIVLSHHLRIGALVCGPVKHGLASRAPNFNSPPMTRTLLIFGLGYSALALTQRLGEDWRIIGTTRRPEKAERLRQQGIEAHLWPGTDLRPVIARATHILQSIAPGPEGDPVAAAYGSDVADAAPHLDWVGYLSTTGVYGDHGGGWVDEETPLTPSTERGRTRVLAERQWQEIAAASGLPLHIFRLAGIYGPGRGPFEKVRNGTARRIIRENQYFSRIHVDDIAEVLARSIARPDPGAIYNVADDDPSPPEDVLAEAARLLGLPLPPEVPFDEAEMTPMARSFYAESKRVRNDRIKTDLGVRLSYPDYRSGLRGLMSVGDA